MQSYQCSTCLYYLITVKRDPDKGMCCLAFPDGIPEEIVTWAVDHSKPYPGDKGIRVRPMEHPEIVKEMFRGKR